MRWHGCDADDEAVRWCERNILDCDFLVNDPLPRLPYADNSFDLVYGVSVFTHLSEDYQTAWLAELRRIVKPEGLLVLSFYSRSVWKPLEYYSAIEKDEFVFSTSMKLKGLYPEWYQTAFQSPSRIQAMFARYSLDVSYQERAFGDQDAAVARRRGDFPRQLGPPPPVASRTKP